MQFKTAGASAAGSLHLDRGTACQDTVLVRTGEGFGFAALSDGAGSKKYAAESARCCCETAAGIFTGRRMTAEEARQAVYEGINSAFAAEGSINTDEYGATLLFVYILNDGSYIAGHVGDGAIFKKGAEGWTVLSEPENGEYINETYFLPDREIGRHLRITTGSAAPGDCFILTSDGISDMLYDPETKETMPACGVLEEILAGSTPAEAQEIYAKELDEFFRRYTRDDMSVAVINVI